ncbi:MAG: DUF2147 domain-containing protein [Deltaproteobacteria bacterium]|nr:DUF2147 domain-containing protein [Deltaproteobacteria bacterium]NND29499.1 DUF2147 domain-containing protein [Myxococcales bacterium]MBT8463074.1 DUF2147 domain-containing protein [Deltaproteobacteria bacterium]MBT8483188.1 DUF2147 domain-containing protein [Deltaproteobacteria bacterium]NNK06462.1 DUF2147 domain-containing protein [Myxococcales bacterium]
MSRRRSVLFALLAGWFILGGLPRAAYALDLPKTDATILGYWQRGEGEAIIQVRRQADGCHGIIVASERRPETVGIEVFRDLRFDEEAGSWHGRAYSIKRKREVPIDIEVPEADSLELTAHILIFKKRVKFKRIPDAQAAGLQLAER